MIEITVIPDGDGAWPDLVDRPFRWFRNVPGEPQAELAIGALSGGMASGNPSVAIRLDIPDEDPIIVETSLKLLVTAVRVLQARHPLQ